MGESERETGQESATETVMKREGEGKRRVTCSAEA